MPLTKKYYNDLVEILGRNCVEIDSPLVKDLIRYFQNDNPRFEAEKFKRALIKACPVKKEQ